MLIRSASMHVDADGVEHYEATEREDEPFTVTVARALTPQEHQLVTDAASQGWRAGWSAGGAEVLRLLRDYLGGASAPTLPTAGVTADPAATAEILARLELVASSVDRVAAAVAAPTVRRVERDAAGQIVAVVDERGA